MVWCQNYALQINGSAKVTMAGPVWLTIAQSNTLGITRTATTGGIICDNEQSRINWIVGTATGNYVFPLMSPDGDNVTAEVNIGTAGSTVTGSLVVSTYHTAVNNTPYPINSDAWFADVTNVWDINGVDNSANVADRFWLINYNGYVTRPTAAVSLKYDAIGGTTDLGGLVEADLMAEYWDGVTWSPYTPLLGVADPPNDLVNGIANVNFNGPWVLVSKFFPLPVELLSFDYKCGSLSWSTATETNCDYFQIFSSEQGDQWTLLGTVNGSGNSNQIQHYQYETSVSSTYFKLVQVDFDGNSHSYGPIYGSCKSVAIDIRVYPNPVDQLIYIVCPDNCKFELYNSMGQLMRSQTLISFNTIDISEIASGLYTVNIVGANYIHSEKLIKNKN